MMTKINEQRILNRTPIVCKIFDCEGKFLGFSFDLSLSGIQVIIDKNFPFQSPFKIFLNYQKEEEIINSDLIVNIEPVWRFSPNEELEQIGGKIIKVDNPKNFEKLVSSSVVNAQKKN
ncbi:hypothetical protein GM3708_566 [Geminocystis sp. NIES-3708]|uniref:PilZ domain-containing protein n=1 Tax=Geminocystis sp. NIES-3708 TaxID=1615909 RepID=UPI0005FCC451|nr:PilZ domain-containing protein [Geminocystis sp. NIES-3708]BAQ60160.1 hypothetical protein GM3708_566 [Geminocystis sp. NIES-3708]